MSGADQVAEAAVRPNTTTSTTTNRGAFGLLGAGGCAPMWVEIVRGSLVSEDGSGDGLEELVVERFA